MLRTQAVQLLQSRLGQRGLEFAAVMTDGELEELALELKQDAPMVQAKPEKCAHCDSPAVAVMPFAGGDVPLCMLHEVGYIALSGTKVC